MKYLLFLLMYCMCMYFETSAQTIHKIELVADICPDNYTKPVTTTGACSSYPTFITEFDSILFFNAATNYIETTYKYDGVNTPSLLIQPNLCIRNPNVVIDGYLYYMGCKNISFKSGLYKWDGKNTPILLKDSSALYNYWLKPLNGKLFIYYAYIQDGAIIEYDLATGKSDTIFHQQAANPIILQNKLYFAAIVDYKVILHSYDPGTKKIKQCAVLMTSGGNYMPNNSNSYQVIDADNDIYYIGNLNSDVLQLYRYNEQTGTTEQLTNVQGEPGVNNWPWLAYNKEKLYLLIDSVGNGSTFFSYDIKSKELKGLFENSTFMKNATPVLYHDKIIFNSHTPDSQLSFYDTKEDYASPIPNPDSSKSFYYTSTIIYKDALYISGRSDNKGAELYKYYDVDPPSPPAKKGLYPNPTTNNCWLESDNPDRQVLDLKITDITGRTVMRNWLGVQNKGAIKIEINTDKLSAGVYYCTLMAPGGILWNGKMVKL